MSTSKEEKVFRKEGKKISKEDENFFGLLSLVSIVFFILGLNLLKKVSFFRFNVLTFITAIGLLVFASLIFLSIVLVSPCFTSPSYILTLREDTLTYKTEDNMVILPLPCSVEKTNSTITFSQNDMKIVLGYTEQEDTELLEFLKDVIN